MVQTGLVGEGVSYRNFQSFYRIHTGRDDETGAEYVGFREEYSVVVFTRLPLSPGAVEKLTSRLRRIVPAEFFRGRGRLRRGSEINEVVAESEVRGPYNWAAYRNERVRDDELVLSETLRKDDLRLRLVPKFGFLQWPDDNEG